MEELGIGRPSTYASTLSVLRDRGYVRIDKKRLLIPEDKGRLVTAFLESFFERYVEYDFTADLEEKLDKISAGEIDWKEVLREFWKQFSADVGETKDLRVTEVLDALNELLGPHIFPARADGGDPRHCPTCGTGKLSLKLGKFGAFIGCSNYPECRYTRQLAADGENGDGAELGADGDPRARPGSRDRLDGDAARPAASAPMSSSASRRGREAEARQPAQGLDAGDHRPRPGAGAAGAAARGRARIPRPASRSPPASAATAPSSCTTAPTPISIRSRRCSRSASTARSPCSPRSGPAAAAAAAGRRRRR